MGAGLCEAAFATVVRLYGSAARDAITGIPSSTDSRVVR